MKSFILLLSLFFVMPLGGLAQQDQWICKGKPVPEGFRVVGETLAPDCGGTAWIIRRVGAKAPPVITSEKRDAELSQGAPEAAPKTVRRLYAGGQDVLNVPVLINGTIELSAYYDGPFTGSDNTHNAFELSDRTGTVYVYALKEESGVLRQKLLAQKGKARGAFTIVLSNPPQGGQEVFADLIGYRLQDPLTKEETSTRGARKRRG